MVGLYPEDPYANYLYGFVNHHHKHSNPETAIPYLSKAVELNEDVTIAIDDLAYAYLEHGDFLSAEKIKSHNVELLQKLDDPLNTYAEILMCYQVRAY